MAISIDWPNKVIFVPKADTLLVQASPTEVRRLDVPTFWRDVIALADDEEGMPWPDPIENIPPTTLSGVTYARVTRVINGYTITFEDGQYTVALDGANNNIGDVTNPNQVRLVVNNSAGLVDLAFTRVSAFGGKVHVSTNGLSPGTTNFPAGISNFPVQTVPDATVIASANGLETVEFEGPQYTLDTGDVLTGYRLRGHSAVTAELIVNPGAEVEKCTFENLRLRGTLDGNNIVERCLVDDIAFFNGVMYNTAVSGVVTLAGGVQATILECYSSVAGGAPLEAATIDGGGSGQELAVRGWRGGIRLRNFQGAADKHSIDMDGGKVTIDTATCTAGTLTVRGDGYVIDENGDRLYSGTYGGFNLVNETSDSWIAEVADEVWAHPEADTLQTQMRDMWEMLGLDSSNPITVSATAYDGTNVDITITDNGNGSYTLQRQ